MATVKELRATAKNLGIVGYSKMKKAELEDAIAKIAANEIVAESPVSAVEERNTIPGDGMMICSFSYAAAMACGMRVITENEYDVFVSRIATVNSLEEAYENVKLRKLIQKIPSVFQIRHEGCKGIVVKYPLEFIPELKDKDLVITEGARKFASSNWEESPLEICNYLKRKDEWVALNPQFIQALKFENPNALIPIVDFWFDKLEKSVNNIALAQEFHGIISSTDGNSDTNSNLVVALRNSSDLVDDFQIINWRRAQYEKFITDMKVGRILVPGEYTYMVCDPAYMLNDIYGLQLDALAPTEYWFNNHVGYAGAFRSPLIAPFEAQKFKCVKREDYWFFKDIVVFNGYDGAWEDMGGGDFDGDTCAIVPDNTAIGKIIVDGIRSMNYVVWEPGLSAIKEEFSWENMAKFNAKVAKVDRTGVITNYASRAMDISNHLESTIYFAKKMNCVGIYMVHPSEVENSSEMQPHVVNINGQRYFAIRGFVHATQNKDGVIMYDNDGVYGVKTFDQIQQIADEYLAKVEYLRLMQGREIDSAKTGVAAEGESGLDFVDSVKVEFTPQEMITRVEVLGRPVAKFAQVNKYQSLSPLARVHDYVEQKSLDFMNRFANGSDKVALLLKLLSAEENAQLKMNVSFADGRTMSLIGYLKARKAEYGKKMSEIFKAELPDEELKDIINGLKTNEISTLNQLAVNLKVSAEVIAVACYIAAYAKNSNFGTGLTYGWLLFDELLSVFTRNNKKFELYRLPKFAEEVSVSAGYLYVNDKKYAPIENVDDCEYIPVQLINGKPYALIHKRSEKVVAVVASQNVGAIYTIDMVYGFKYSCGSKDEWKRIVKESGYQFTVDFDNNSRLSVFAKSEDIIKIAESDIKFACHILNVEYNDSITIDDIKNVAVDTVIGAIKATVADLHISELVGHEVKIIGSPNYKETESTIANLVVRVVK